MIKFIHMRHQDRSEGTNRGKPATRGGITVAYEAQPSGAVFYGLARCHENDNYNRAVGRAKATGRLHSRSAAQAHNRGVIRSDNSASTIQRIVFDLVERGIWNGV